MNKRSYNPIFAKILISAVVLLLTLTTHAKVYKWTDENGKVHYSDKPIDEKSEQIKIKRQPTDAEVLRARQRASTLIQHQNKVQSIANEEARDKQVEVQKKEKEKGKLKQVCKNARREILVYSGRGVIYTLDENGKKTYKGYTDEQKNKMIADLEQFIKANCSGL